MDKKLKYALVGIVIFILCWFGFLFIAGLNGIFPIPT
jgi:hypothetical protein